MSSAHTGRIIITVIIYSKVIKMKVAKAKYHNGGEHYSDYIKIGDKEFTVPTFVEMWNKIPEQIRKPIQENEENDY
jgi:hypothetical protein